MVKWTENINGEPYTSRGVRTVRRRVLGNTTIVIWKGAGYLAYIVSVKVRADGSRIDMQNIGKVQSEKTRKELELKYGLVRAEDHKQSLFKLKPVDAKKVQYGKTQTRRAIGAVLGSVLKSYKYTSIAELNAVLGLYNVAADPGSEGSRTARNKGLFYHVLDGDGNKVGVPIKASLFHDKPTLKTLEDRFIVNDALRQPHKARVKSAVDFALIKGSGTTIEAMIKELGKKGIDTIIRQNEQGAIYGITYVDHSTKSIFNGSDLGKTYSAKGIMERCGHQIQKGLTDTTESKHQNTAADKNAGQKGVANQIHKIAPVPLSAGNGGKGDSIIEMLIQPETGSNYLPSEWKKKRKRKKKNQSNNM